MFDHSDHSGTSYKNVHCFVSLAMSALLLVKGSIKYINILINYKLYDKSKTKLKLVTELIEQRVPDHCTMRCMVYQKDLLSRILTFDFVEPICAVRVDTATYQLTTSSYWKKPFGHLENIINYGF